MTGWPAFPSSQVIGVEPEDAAGLTLSMKAGQVIPLSSVRSDDGVNHNHLSRTQTHSIQSSDNAIIFAGPLTWRSVIVLLFFLS